VSYVFTRAVTRVPSKSIVHGLRARDIGAPDLSRMLAAHQDYITALHDAGLAVTELAALEDYPDSIFVEDTALCLAEGAILMRPGAPTRAGEVAHMAPTLCGLYGKVLQIEGPGFIEGGDILVHGKQILVGRSARTDAAGIAELAGLVGTWGYEVRELITPPGVLHFKTDCSLLGENTVLATERLAASGCFADYQVILPCAGEEAAANAIRCNDLVLMAAGFPGTSVRVRQAGFNVREIDNSECAKLDGGMSCLSLRF
jgi:dimethylargininase